MDKAMPLLRGEEGEVVGGQSGKKSSEKRTGKKSRERRTGKKSREKELGKKHREKEPERSIGKNKKSLKSKKETRDA